jgi:hypothetical protein
MVAVDESREIDVDAKTTDPLRDNVSRACYAQCTSMSKVFRWTNQHMGSTTLRVAILQLSILRNVAILDKLHIQGCVVLFHESCAYLCLAWHPSQNSASF